jgi:hypothetical protein
MGAFRRGSPARRVGKRGIAASGAGVEYLSAARGGGKKEPRDADMRSLLIAIAAALMSAAPALAQEGEYEEIVVTGSRLESYERLITPHVTVVRRADFAVVDVEVRSDTRDESQRLDEIRQALRGLQSRSRPGHVTLALRDEDAQIVRGFSMQAAEDLFTRGRLADTSRVTVLLRTPISPQDTLESLRARVDSFVAAAQKPGRVEMQAGELSLSMLDPNRFRPQLLAAIAADARAVASAMGAGYTPSVGGLENQVAWKRTGDLDLTLFLPYTIEARPPPP